MDELAHRFLVAAHQHGDLRRPLATGAGQHHLAATHQHAIRRAQTGCQGRALLVGERTDKDGRSHTSQDTPFRPTFTEITLASAMGYLTVVLPRLDDTRLEAPAGLTERLAPAETERRRRCYLEHQRNVAIIAVKGAVA